MGQFDSNKFKGEKVEWETPLGFFTPLNKEFGFTLDVAADEENKKCNSFYSIEQDGLNQDWSNQICWCNPPYGRIVPKWIEKAKEEAKKGATSVLLILAKTNTKWFHNLCMNANEIRFVKGRPKFVGAKDGLPFPLMLVIFKPKNEPCKIGSYDWKDGS